MPTRGRIPFPVLLGIATVFGVSSTIQAYWLSRVSGDNEPMGVHLLILNLVYWYVPALLAPIVVQARHEIPDSPRQPDEIRGGPPHGRAGVYAHSHGGDAGNTSRADERPLRRRGGGMRRASNI